MSRTAASAALQDRLDRSHRRARASPPFQRLAIVSRILLALAFVPTGLVKLLGERFTTLPVTTPVGAYFEAMYQTGFYWNFLGLGQVVAGVLLLIPATATLGAVLFFPIMLNITVVTWSIGFRGTLWITPLMLLAGAFLLCWDYDRLKAILFRSAHHPPVPRARVSGLEKAGYVLGTTAGLVVLGATRSMLPGAVVPWMLALGALAVLLVLAAWFRPQSSV